MRLALIVDAYAPARTSAAVQMGDLARQLAGQGHSVTLLVPDSTLGSAFSLERDGACEVLRLRAPRTKDIGRVRRALAESLLPFAMLRNLGRSPHSATRWDGLVWYSPTIFFGPLAAVLKRRHRSAAYLILRDMFPDWAVDAVHMSRGLAYRYFKAVEKLQYRAADVIGVQSPGNLAHAQATAGPDRRVEVLDNWLSDRRPGLGHSAAGGEEVTFVYAGNMGVAQGMDQLLSLAERFGGRPNVRFRFVGRGTEVQRLREAARALGLANVSFEDEVSPDALPALLAECDVGLVALDPRHRTHNIPGKFLTYLQAGMPVLAAVNPGNDLASVIRRAEVGMAAESNAAALAAAAETLAGNPDLRADMGQKARALWSSRYSTEAAAGQVAGALRRILGESRAEP